jgi:hypothetical protein
MQDLFNEYLAMAKLNKADGASAKDKLRLFKIMWDEMKATVNQNVQALVSSHFKVKTNLNYYLDAAFLQGMTIHTDSLIDSGKVVEASHYLEDIFLNIIENYVWLKSSIEKVKIDYTTLMRSLESLEEKNPKNYDCMIKFLNLENVAKPDAAGMIGKSREIILKIRKDRKTLIKNSLLKN